MAISDLSTHPFQVFDLEHNTLWQGIEFQNVDNPYFEEQTRLLDVAFRNAVEHGRFLCFFDTYTEISLRMLRRAEDQSLLAPVLEDALARLVGYYQFLRSRTRPYLCKHDSIYSWQLDDALLASARHVAAEMERDGTAARDYNLHTDPRLKEWTVKNVQPILRQYVDSVVCCPWAHIRYADAAKHGEGWSHIYRQHEYAYFHFDEVCYSFPLIIYLDDVSAASGPFSYVHGTDKMAQNLVLRAFHQALWHGCKILCHEEADRRTLASLPSVFRGGDLVGSFTGPQPFASQRVVPFIGRSGMAVLFEGFQLLHAGGHPSSGSRKALFVAFRFPRQKIWNMLVPRTVRIIWRKRVARALTQSKQERH